MDIQLVRVALSCFAFVAAADPAYRLNVLRATLV